jgi:hypothetical protein
VGLPPVRATLLRADSPGALRGVDLAALPGDALWLDLDDVSGLAAFHKAAPRPVTRVIVRHGEHALAALAAGIPEVKLLITAANLTWIEAHVTTAIPGLMLGLETHELLSETARHTPDLRALFSRYAPPVPVEDIPACLAGPAARAPRTRLFDTNLLDVQGRFSMVDFVSSFVVEHYFVKSLRCRECVHDDAGPGVHVNQARAHGFAQLVPIRRAP